MAEVKKADRFYHFAIKKAIDVSINKYIIRNCKESLFSKAKAHYMKSKIDLIRQTRTKALEIISGLSISELNKIPTGFNNNIIWNLGHLIAAQEGIFYLRGKLELNIEQEFFNSFKNGSRPEREIHAEEIEKIRSLLFSSLDQFEADLGKNTFHNYPAWTTSMGIQINSIEDALDFLPFHEGLHLGHVMVYKRLIS